MELQSNFMIASFFVEFYFTITCTIVLIPTNKSKSQLDKQQLGAVQQFV